MIQFERLKTSEVGEHLERWLLLPVGSTEQHGENLPLSVDSDIATYLCHQIALNVKGVLAPTIKYSARSIPSSGGGDRFKGNIYVSGSVFTQYIEEILFSYVRNGFQSIVLVNGHFENLSFLLEAVEKNGKWIEEKKLKILILNWWDVLSTEYLEEQTHGRFKNWNVEHAGFIESAIQLFIAPETVTNPMKNGEDLDIDVINSYPILKKNRTISGSLSNQQGATSQLGATLMKYCTMKIIEVMKELEETNDSYY